VYEIYTVAELRTDSWTQSNTDTLSNNNGRL